MCGFSIGWFPSVHSRTMLAGWKWCKEYIQEGDPPYLEHRWSFGIPQTTAGIFGKFGSTPHPVIVESEGLGRDSLQKCTNPGGDEPSSWAGGPTQSSSVLFWCNADECTIWANDHPSKIYPPFYIEVQRHLLWEIWMPGNRWGGLGLLGSK